MLVDERTRWRCGERSGRYYGAGGQTCELRLWKAGLGRPKEERDCVGIDFALIAARRQFLGQLLRFQVACDRLSPERLAGDDAIFVLETFEVDPS